MHAQHWFSAERLAELGQPWDPSGAPRWCTLGGFYTNTLVRTTGGRDDSHDRWRISRCQLDVTWTTGDPTVFELARSLGDPAERTVS
jgi:hypothetical protein